jgi:hypothetical protein
MRKVRKRASAAADDSHFARKPLEREVETVLRSKWLEVGI